MNAIRAIVNHGRWIGNCPICNGAEKVSTGRTFVCHSQLPNFDGGYTTCGFEAEVIFPDNKIQIESILVKRSIVNRNWEWSESAEMLIRDNIDHGVM